MEKGNFISISKVFGAAWRGAVLELFTFLFAGPREGMSDGVKGRVESGKVRLYDDGRQ